MSRKKRHSNTKFITPKAKPLETLGERLREARQKKGYTQPEASELLSISPRTIQNHEYDRNKPPHRRLKQYASLYECTWEWLLTGKEIYPDTEKPPMIVHAPTEEYAHSNLKPEEGQRERLHAMLNEILEKGDIGLINAISSNLQQFRRILSLERRLQAVEKKAGIDLPEHEASLFPEQSGPSSKPR